MSDERKQQQLENSLVEVLLINQELMSLLTVMVRQLASLPDAPLFESLPDAMPEKGQSMGMAIVHMNARINDVLDRHLGQG